MDVNQNKLPNHDWESIELPMGDHHQILHQTTIENPFSHDDNISPSSSLWSGFIHHLQTPQQITIPPLPSPPSTFFPSTQNITTVGGSNNYNDNDNCTNINIEDHEDHQQQQLEEPEEELGAMKEMMYRIAAMQPVDIDPATIRKPKRRNIRISEDPQSVAARHRRERISEKIRILQRLVPGGTKMDTASMLEEAIRYVKFLKKQIRLLQQQPPSHHHHQQLPQCNNINNIADNHQLITPHRLTSLASFDHQANRTSGLRYGGGSGSGGGDGGGGVNNPIRFNHEVSIIESLITWTHGHMVW